MKKLYTVFFILLTTLTIPSILYSDTEVSGNVQGEWTSEGSPYVATNDLTLGERSELNIEAGVEVLFDGNFCFTIHGTLIAEGSEGDSILFSQTERREGWGGLRIINADSDSRLDYCIITGGRAAGGEGHGDIPSSGGNVFIYQTNLTINHSRISGGFARGFGAGIAIWSADPTISNCVINDNQSSENGGGMEIIYESSPTIENCYFESNSTNWTGGAVCIESHSNPEFRNCTFQQNTAIGGGAVGLYFASSPEFSHCNFIENDARMGGAAYLRNEGSRPLLEWCYFYRNDATQGDARSGGAIILRDFVAAEIRYCRFIENEAGIGGAITVWDPPHSYIHHNLFINNQAIAGGALATNERFENRTLEIDNCTFINNQAPGEECNVAFVPGHSFLSFSSCIIWGPEPHFWSRERVTVNFSHISSGYQGEGNSEEYPGLFEMDSTWCMLRGDSPCVDSGNPDLPEDPDESRNDRGWLHFPHNALEGLETDNFEVEIGEGERQVVSVGFRNETGVPIYATPMDKWQSSDPEMIVNVSAITDDSEISAVAWTSDGYLLAGGNSGESPNKLYRLNREFRLTGQFDQPGPWDSEPIWELAGDGDETLYGSAGDEIIEFYSNGEIGDVYGGPGGFQVCRGLGADFNYADDPPDIYIGGDEGLISRVDWEMHERQRYDAHYPVMAIGAKGNMRGIYLITEPFPSLYLLSLLITDDSLIVPLYRLIPPHGEYRVGGIEVTQDIQSGHGTLIGVWRGEGNNTDRLYILDLYTSWLAIRPDLKLLMPEEETEWEIVFAGDQVPAGEYESVFYLTVNGYGEDGEIQARMLLNDASVQNDLSNVPATVILSPAYPNPFNSRARFSYYLPQASGFRINLIDPTGRMVQTLFSGQAESGEYNGWIDAGKLSSGIYYLRLETSRSATVASVTVFK